MYCILYVSFNLKYLTMKKNLMTAALAVVTFMSANAQTFPPEIGVHNYGGGAGCADELMVVLYALSTSTGSVVATSNPQPMSTWDAIPGWDSTLVSTGPGWASGPPPYAGPNAPFSWYWGAALVYSSCNTTPGGTGPTCGLGSPVVYDVLNLNTFGTGIAQDCLEITMPCVSCNPGFTLNVHLSGSSGGSSSLGFN